MSKNNEINSSNEKFKLNQIIETLSSKSNESEMKITRLEEENIDFQNKLYESNLFLNKLQKENENLKFQLKEAECKNERLVESLNNFISKNLYSSNIITDFNSDISNISQIDRRDQNDNLANNSYKIENAYPSIHLEQGISDPSVLVNNESINRNFIGKKLSTSNKEDKLNALKSFQANHNYAKSYNNTNSIDTLNKESKNKCILLTIEEKNKMNLNNEIQTNISEVNCNQNDISNSISSHINEEANQYCDLSMKTEPKQILSESDYKRQENSKKELTNEKKSNVLEYSLNDPELDILNNDSKLKIDFPKFSKMLNITSPVFIT